VHVQVLRHAAVQADRFAFACGRELGYLTV
jgi:hypothetical protein